MLSSFCFVKLRAAGKFISWISLVLSLVLTAIFGLSCVGIKVPPIERNILDAKYSKIFLPYFDLFEFFYTEVPSSLGFTTALLSSLVSGFLVVGTIKERHLLFRPWLIFYGTVLTLGPALYLLMFFMPLAFIINLPYGNLYLVGLLIGYFFGFYVHYGIYSLYKKIQCSNVHYGFYSLYKKIQCSNVEKCPLIHHEEANAVSNLEISSKFSYIKV